VPEESDQAAAEWEAFLAALELRLTAECEWMRGFLLVLRDGAMAAAPEDSERRAARDVASWRLEQQEEAVVLGLIGTETGITALVRLAGDGAQPPEQRRTALEALELKASECHDSERYSLLERIEAFLEEQLRADALDLLVVGQAGWAEHDHRLPLLQGAARGMQLAASEVLPLFGSGAGRKLPMLTLRAEEEAGDLRIRTEVLEVPVWQLPMPSGEQLKLVVPAGESTIGSAAEEAGHDVYSPGCAACEVRHELSQRHQASAWSWLVHLDEMLDLMGSALYYE
jgi:hypothetical protein